MTELDDALASIHSRFEANRFVSQPAIRAVTTTLGIDISVESVGAPAQHFIASATKPMLAVALLRQLAVSGLSVDSQVRDIIPAEMAGIPHADELTVRHLLSHTSGMFDYWSVHGLAAHRGPQPLAQWANEHPGWSIDDVVELTRRNPVAAEPGQKFAYCGTNYQFATRVLEVLSGLSAADALRVLVFTPAQMADTYLFTHSDLHRFDSVATVLLGTATYSAARRMASLGGEGGVVSTLADTNRFLNWVERGDGVDGGWSTLMHESRPFSPGIEYGLGVMQVSLPRVMTGWVQTPTVYGHYGMTGFAMMSTPDSGWRMSTTVNQMSKQLIGARLFANVLQAVSRSRPSV